ncbi:MAG: hypothetical protein IJ793_04075 [Opitutales bacterium]|nr:hypothetical protein [Opitutales bacterium]
MFREIVVAGGMFVSSFFFDGSHIFAKEPEQSCINPYCKNQNTNPRERMNPKYIPINNSDSYSKQKLITLLENSIQWRVGYHGRDLRAFREKVEGFCECILKDVYASLCGIVSKYLQDVECVGSNVSQFLMLEQGYKHGPQPQYSPGVPEVSYVGLSEDCYRDEKLPSFFKQDAEILTNFLLNQILPDYDETVENLHKRVAIVGKGSVFLKDAFKERKITLKVFSHFLGSGTMKNMEKSNNEFFSRLRNILEEGEIFQNGFIDIFWKTFVERSDAFALFDFFGNYVPVSKTDMSYGLTVYKFVAKQETFKNLFDDELLAIIDEIDRILAKRLEEKKDISSEEKKGTKNNVMEFFLRMDERLEETKKAAEKELEKNKKYSDPWYWKSEPHFNNKEKKKIFDELNESEEQVKDDGCELKKRTSKVTSKPISTQRMIFQRMPMMPAPGWKITWGKAGVPEVSIEYEF